jgi:hypothetical protein
MKQLLLILTQFFSAQEIKVSVVTDDTKQPYQAHQF